MTTKKPHNLETREERRKRALAAMAAIYSGNFELPDVLVHVDDHTFPVSPEELAEHPEYKRVR